MKEAEEKAKHFSLAIVEPEVFCEAKNAPLNFGWNGWDLTGGAYIALPDPQFGWGERCHIMLPLTVWNLVLNASRTATLK